MLLGAGVVIGRRGMRKAAPVAGVLAVMAAGVLFFAPPDGDSARAGWPSNAMGDFRASTPLYTTEFSFDGDRVRYVTTIAAHLNRTGAPPLTCDGELPAPPDDGSLHVVVDFSCSDGERYDGGTLSFSGDHGWTWVDLDAAPILLSPVAGAVVATEPQGGNGPGLVGRIRSVIRGGEAKIERELASLREACPYPNGTKGFSDVCITRTWGERCMANDARYDDCVSFRDSYGTDRDRHQYRVDAPLEAAIHKHACDRFPAECRGEPSRGERRVVGRQAPSRGGCSEGDAARLLLAHGQRQTSYEAVLGRGASWAPQGPCAWLVTGALVWRDPLSNGLNMATFSAAVSGVNGQYSVDMFQLTGAM
jgi:hypothetical protein